MVSSRNLHLADSSTLFDYLGPTLLSLDFIISQNNVCDLLNLRIHMQGNKLSYYV
jgi:hypothetical protein